MEYYASTKMKILGLQTFIWMYLENNVKWKRDSEFYIKYIYVNVKHSMSNI